MDHVQSEAFAGFLQHALRLFRLFQDLADLRESGNLGHDALAQQQADLVDHHELARIGDGDGELSVRGFFQRDEVVAEHQVNWDLLEQVVVELEVVQVHELAAIAARNVSRTIQFVSGSSGNHRAAVAAVHEQ